MSRKKYFSIGLTEKELADLMRLSEEAGVSRSRALGRLVERAAGGTPPDERTGALLLELRRAGSALDDLRRRAERGWMPEAAELRAALEENRRAEELLLRSAGV